jgi:hypothetical protein
MQTQQKRALRGIRHNTVLRTTAPTVERDYNRLHYRLTGVLRQSQRAILQRHYGSGRQVDKVQPLPTIPKGLYSGADRRNANRQSL